MDLIQCKALQTLDRERTEHDNELCKVRVNLSPYDLYVSSARENSLVSERSKDLEDKLQTLTTTDTFKALKAIMGREEFTAVEAMPAAISLFEECEIRCRDIPAT